MSDLDPQAIVANLDALSRKRALTDAESRMLERAIRAADRGVDLTQIPLREAVRLGVKRFGGLVSPAGRARDPRVRRVVSSQQVSKRRFELALDCGHTQRRQMLFEAAEVICTECPVPAEWAAKNLGRSTALPEIKRPIGERLAAAKAFQIARGRTPRAFYLAPADFAEFSATEPPTITALFDNIPIEVFGFEGIAVRESKSRIGRSVLYCCIGSNVQVPIR